MHPFQFQPPHEANSPPSSGDRRTNFQRRRPGLSIPIPYRDPTTAVPLPLPPRRPTPFPLPPINFSDLEQLNYIGSGRGGTVYSVLHRPTNKLYALKSIAGAHEPAQRKHIQSEVRILRSVDHPNVVKCYDDMYDEHDSKIQVLLEYMDVGSLNGARIISEATLANVTKQILTGLVYLHSMRIVHRDIKPSNLLTNSKNEVKIADFGVSRILSRTMDPCNSSVGTIVYMSPERINTESNDGRYDGYAGDVWSLGICVLEFYLGTLPFKGITRESADWGSLVWAICMSTPPAAPPNSSREFQDFIDCCLKSNPTERWSAARLLQHPFIVMYGGATSASAGLGAGNNNQGRQSVYQQYASSSSYN